MRYSQQGFTLIELMVSLVLGMIIVAAATLLFISGQKSFALQQGAADIQDNANFALNYMTKDIRMANLNGSTASMTSSLANGGIVFSTANLAGIADTAISQSALSDTSNVAVGSDQLTIQYLPQQTGGFDCEGTQITSTSVYVVQRYFVRQDTNVNTNETAATALALVCAAGRSNNMTAFNDKTGQIIMKRVDYFHILLSVQNSAGNIRDMTIAQYVARNAKQVIGIESVQEAIDAAKEHAELNGLSNCTFYCGDMKDIFNDDFLAHHPKADVLITDPPRDGMHKDVVEMLLKTDVPKIVYVSCNSATQARDLALMDEKYKVVRVRPVDMFPQTHHVENVVLLEKR